MKRLGPRFRPLLGPDAAETARDLVARAQAALDDSHRAGAERHILQLYDLLIPAIDTWALQKSTDAQSVAPALLSLWHELPDIDAERESVEELLLWNAGHLDIEALPAHAASPASDEAERTTQRNWLAQSLQEASLPRSQWWRRLTRRALGPLSDCAHITVQRQATVVLERGPEPSAVQPHEAVATTSLGVLHAGDRLTLRWPVRVPGRVLVLHALGDDTSAELDQVLPDPQGDASEGVPRRAQEVVEVIGEVAATPHTRGDQEHSLILIWGPEMLPGTWGHEVLVRRCVPAGSRVWRYSYSVLPDTGSGP